MRDMELLVKKAEYSDWFCIKKNAFQTSAYLKAYDYILNLS